MNTFGQLKIKERCTMSGSCLIRRGIPFAQGELSQNETVMVVDAHGNRIPSQNRILQTFPNGDIRWMAVSFETRLQAGEEQVFSVKSAPLTESSQVPVATLTENGYILKNNTSLCLEIVNHTVKSLSYQGKVIVSDMALQVRMDGKIYDFQPTASRLLENGDVFAQVLIEGKFSDTEVYGTWILTMHQNDTELYQEAKFNARKELTMQGQWIHATFADSFSASAQERDIVTMASETAEIGLCSKDIERFFGTVEGETGFFCENGSLVLAPIQYHNDFLWPDGVQRTFRLQMMITEPKKALSEAKRMLHWSFSQPTAVLDAKRFVTAGYLDMVCRSGALKRIEELVTSLYGKCWHHIEAGKMPHGFQIDYETNSILESPWKSLHRSHGELDYNLWTAFMNSGNETMADMLSEHMEFWTDIMFYRGQHTFLHGEIRYKTGMSWHTAYDFSASTPYYADSSGLYYCYMMTGDAYLGECLKETAYHMLEGFEKSGYPVVSYWFLDGSWLSHYDAPDFQIRFIAAIRCMYFAYELYQDERFLKVTESTMDYVKQIQHEEGLFFEAYDRVTMQPTAYYQSPYGVVEEDKFAYLDKTYIIAFGMRAVCEYYKMHPYAPALEVLEDVADYFWRQMMDDGWFFQPNSTDRYFNNENQRGCCGVTNVCVMSFFAALFDITNKRKHFLWMLKVTRFYLSAYGSKGFGMMLSVGPLGFLKFGPKIAKLLKENRALAISMGYYDVVSIFEDETTAERDKAYDSRDGKVTKQIFHTPNGQVWYFNVNTADLQPTYTCMDYFTTLTEALNEEGRIWIGAPNFVTGSSVYIESEVKRVGLVHLMETDIFLSGNETKVRIALYRLTQEEIIFNIKGKGNVQITIKDGLFPVGDEPLELLEYRNCCEVVPKNGKLELNLSLNGELQYFKLCKPTSKKAGGV